MLKHLRIAFTALSLTVCVLLIVLWLRSYSFVDICGLTFAGQARTNFVSKNGRIWLIILDYKTYVWAVGKTREWDIRSEPVSKQYQIWTTDDDLINDTGAPKLPGLYLKRFPNGYYRAIVPHRYFVLLAALLSAAPWVHWSRCRFGLRTLLIATTFVAIALGVIAAMK
jgi:hypothetical protein